MSNNPRKVVFYDVQEVADLIGVTPSTVESLVKAGKIPSVIWNGKRVFPSGVLRVWMEDVARWEARTRKNPPPKRGARASS